MKRIKDSIFLVLMTPLGLLMALITWAFYGRRDLLLILDAANNGLSKMSKGES